MQGLQYDSARHNDAFLVYAVVDCHFGCWFLDPWVSHGERIMNERIKALAKQAKIPEYHLEYGTELCIAPHLEKFAELLLKESFTIIKAAMVDTDMLAVDEIISDRLDEAAYDVCDQLGLLGPIYEG